MKKITLISAFVFIVMASCQKSSMKTSQETTTAINSERYDAVETFEVNDPKTKPSYATDTVTLGVGSWVMNQALIANLDADAKNGNFSARFQQKVKGYIETNFSIQNLDTLVFSYGKYNNTKDGSPTLTVKVISASEKTIISKPILVSNSLLKTDTIVINSNEKVRVRFESDGLGRLNIDDITFKGKNPSGIVFNQDIEGGNTDVTSGNNGANGAKEPPRNVIAGTDAQPTTGDNSNLMLGNPSEATNNVLNKNNFLIDQRYYTESYDADRGTPNWVSWHLQAEDANGAAKRQDNFAAWLGMPSEWYQVTQSSYNGSGYDRGHNCPSADRSSSANANSSTFLMTNMIPQAPQNNQKTWNNLEMYIRDQVRAGMEAYIIMGSYGELKKIDNNRISVPSHVWKVVLLLPKGDGDMGRINANTTVLAVNTPNDNSVKEDWKAYIVSIADIENATGYTLLSALPAAIKSELKNKKFNPN